MEILNRLARWVFVACIPFFAITSAIAIAINSSWLYTSGFARYDVKQSLAEAGLTLTDGQLKDIATGFIQYFNSKKQYINLTVQQNGKPVELFNQDEIQHFSDVKKLFWLDYYVLFGTFGYCLLYALTSLFWQKGKYRLRLARSALTGGAITLGIMTVAGIGIFLDFDWLWYHFHLIAFSNDLWSAGGYMLILLPDGFWTYMVTAVALMTAGLALLIGAAGGTYLLYSRIRNNYNQITR